MPATRASSEAVSARPSISACSIAARAGSPASAATCANMALLGIWLASSAAQSIPRGAVMVRWRPYYFGGRDGLPIAAFLRQKLFVEQALAVVGEAATSNSAPALPTRKI